MSKRKLMSLVLAVAFTLTISATSYSQAQSSALSKTRLMKLLLLGDSSQEFGNRNHDSEIKGEA